MGGFKTKAEGIWNSRNKIRKAAVNSFHKKAHVFCYCREVLRCWSWLGPKCLNSRFSNTIHLLPVTHKRVHEKSLLNKPFPLGVFILEIPVVVIGNNDSIPLIGNLHYVAIIVANHPLAFHLPWGCVDQDRLLFQLLKNVLIWWENWQK